MSNTSIFQEGTEPEPQRTTSWFPWHRIPAVTGDVLGGRRTLVLFRYISWFLTSLFYLAGDPKSNVFLNLGIIIALLLSARTALRLYSDNKRTRANTFGLIIADTLFIAVLLVPTGGLGSPFMWYALNPIFMAISLLPLSYCWGVMGVMAAAVTATAICHGDTAGIISGWQKYPWFTLVFLLLTTAALLFARLAKQLSEAYEKLSCAHQSTERLLEHISDLYHAMESFSMGEDPRHLAALLAGYARKLTGAQAGVCCLIQDQYQSCWETSDPGCLLSHLEYQKIDAVWRELQEGQSLVYRLPLTHSGPEAKEIVCVPLQTTGACFGLLGYVVNQGPKSQVNEERAINYLAELVAIILERRRADVLAVRLMVAEEQNRIANEIHDGVSQHLFSIVYALHALSRKQVHLQEPEVQQQLGLIRKTANQAARELRASIYRISPSKRGEQVFLGSVAAYLEDLARLNSIKVDFLPEGTEEALSPALRKALYRIISEATSNAIRHGKCKHIKVTLRMAPGTVVLQVVDDGRGFKVTEQTQKGLGMANMHSLMTSFNGRLTVQSEPGNGTRITCAIPEDAAGDEFFRVGGADVESRCG